MNRIASLALLAACALAAATAHADVVKLNGATTFVNVVVDPARDAVQKKTGHTLEIVGNATGKGLVDLVEGRADAAMVSEPLDIAVAAAKVAGKDVDASKLKMHEIRKDEIVFVVNPKNPVSALTLDQLKDIHTGKITNWKAVGGKDAPIVVYSDAVTGGTRAMIRKVVMNNAEYAPEVKSLTAVKRVAELVAKDENGVGGLGRGFVGKDDKVIKTTKVERPLAIVTVGDPSPKVKQVIDALRAAQ